MDERSSRLSNGKRPVTRDEVVAIARAWTGTPYHHQMSVQGVGCDCLGLVRGVWRELHGAEPQSIPAYSRDWAEASGIETLIAAARVHFFEIPRDQAQAGDIAVFRFRTGYVAKHVGILTAATTMVHACEGGPVCEVALSPWWRRRVAATFAFPGIAG